jgi:hypothetical protein
MSDVMLLPVGLIHCVCVCVCLVTEQHQNICMQNTAHWSKMGHTASMESVIGMFCDSHSV